ncbi:hypothetical protein GOQ04_22535 [Emticicia sp. ODNR4P]|nr:hypothetical protein [Emticicia sp. ODNR4P]
MKIVIVMAIREFEEAVKKLFKSAKIRRFSYLNSTDYQYISEEHFEGNWFGQELHEVEAVVFYAFSSQEEINDLAKNIAEFNAQHESTDPIRWMSFKIDNCN